jgi:hypothetical protein
LTELATKQRRRRLRGAALIEVALLDSPYGPITLFSFEQFPVPNSHTW